MSDLLTVIVADDHPVVRKGLVSILDVEPDISILASVSDGQAAVEAALRERPSAIVMDLRMPVLDGVAATAAIIAEWPEATVLVLTTYDTDEAIVRAIEAGASGYLLKDAPPNVLIDAVRRCSGGETVLAPPVARRLVERVRDPLAASLTIRELEILRNVARGNTNADIARLLHISQATVKSHLVHIYEKLGVSDRAAAVSRAYECGMLTR